MVPMLAQAFLKEKLAVGSGFQLPLKADPTHNLTTWFPERGHLVS